MSQPIAVIETAQRRYRVQKDTRRTGSDRVALMQLGTEGWSQVEYRLLRDIDDNPVGWVYEILEVAYGREPTKIIPYGEQEWTAGYVAEKFDIPEGVAVDPTLATLHDPDNTCYDPDTGEPVDQ